MQFEDLGVTPLLRRCVTSYDSGGLLVCLLNNVVIPSILAVINMTKTLYNAVA